MSEERIIRREVADVAASAHTALIVLDGEGEAYRTEIPYLLEAARASGVLVIFTEYQPIRPRSAQNTEKTNGSPGLMCETDIVIPRINNSCFYGNGLHSFLQEKKIETVVLCGGKAETSTYTSLCEAQYHDYYACIAWDTVERENEEVSACVYALIQKRYRTIDARTIADIWRAAVPEFSYKPACAEQKQLDPEHTALLVIDMQKDFCDPDGEYAKTRNVGAVQKIIPVIQELVNDAHRQGVLVVYFSQFTPPCDRADNGASLAFKTRDGKKPTYALEGSAGQQYIHELPSSLADVVVPKLRSNGFHDTWIEKILRANAITHLVITGTQTEGCVLGTMMGAEQNGFTVIPVEDGMETSVESVQESALKLIDYRFSLWSSKEVMHAWKREDKAE